MFLITNGHTLFDHALHTAETNTQLVLDQLPYRLDTAVTEVINIIRLLNAIIDLDHAAEKLDDIALGYGTMRNGNIQIKFLIQLVTTHTFEVVMTLIKQLLFKELTSIVERGRVAWAHLAEELNQGSFSNGQTTREIPFGFLLQRGSNEHALGVIIHIAEQGQQFFVGAGLQRSVFDTIVDSG